MEVVKRIRFHLGNIEDRAYAESDYETIGKVKGFCRRIENAMLQYEPDKKDEYHAIKKMIYDKDFVKYSIKDVEFVYYYFTAWKERETSFASLNETIINRLFDDADVISKLDKMEVELSYSEEAVEKIIKIRNNVALLSTKLSLMSKKEILKQIIKSTGEEYWKYNSDMLSIHTYYLSKNFFFIELNLREKYKETDELMKEKYPF